LEPTTAVSIPLQDKPGAIAENLQHILKTYKN